MNNVKCYTKRVIMKHLCTFLFAFFSFFLSAQVYSGVVTMTCTNTPLSEVELEITGFTDGVSFKELTKTNSKGEFSFEVSGTDSYWSIRVNSESESHPKEMVFYPSGGSKSDLEFDLLYKPQIVVQNGGAESVMNSNTFESPHYLCAEDRICLSVEPYNDLFANDDERHCFSANVYELDERGKRIKSYQQQCFDMNPTLNSQGNACAPYEIELQIEEDFMKNVGRRIEVVIIQSCCFPSSDCPYGYLLNKTRLFFEIHTIPVNSTNYVFAVPHDTDEKNDSGDPVDGVEPLSQLLPGPELTPLSSALFQKYPSEEPLEKMIFNLYEVDCDSTNVEPNFIQSIPVETNTQMVYFSFGNLTAINDEPYFLKEENFVDKCFLIEAIAQGYCGSVSSYSFFTIGKKKTVSSSKQISDVKNQLNVYPNPASDILQLSIENCTTPIKLEIYNTNGRCIKKTTIDCNHPTLKINELKSGVYFIRNAAEPNKSIRFVKI